MKLPWKCNGLLCTVQIIHNATNSIKPGVFSDFTILLTIIFSWHKRHSNVPEEQNYHYLRLWLDAYRRNWVSALVESVGGGNGRVNVSVIGRGCRHGMVDWMYWGWDNTPRPTQDGPVVVVPVDDGGLFTCHNGGGVPVDPTVDHICSVRGTHWRSRQGRWSSNLEHNNLTWLRSNNRTKKGFHGFYLFLRVLLLGLVYKSRGFYWKLRPGELSHGHNSVNSKQNLMGLD